LPNKQIIIAITTGKNSVMSTNTNSATSTTNTTSTSTSTSSSTSSGTATATTTTTKTTRTRNEKVYVLYGSQTGNSEEAAVTFTQEIKDKLSPMQLQKMTGTIDTIKIQPVHMQLDDFLEIEKAAWTRIIIIFVSSYGVGQAPLGCYRFRDLCEVWLKQNKENAGNNNNTDPALMLLLQGVQFCLCGLGDSRYTTFFQNPKTIHEALLHVGANRIGPVGKADANTTTTTTTTTTNESQADVIEQWKASIWQPLAEVVVSEPLVNSEQLKKMQLETIRLCIQINPDFEPPVWYNNNKHKNKKNNSSMNTNNNNNESGGNNNGSDNGRMVMVVLPVFMVLLAILAFYLFQSSW